MKLLGAGFLWISLICLGLNYAYKLKTRTRLLEKTSLLIKQIKIEAEFLQLPLYEMLLKLSHTGSFSKLDFLDICCDFILHGEDFPVAWRRSIEASSLKYMSSEREKLLLLGESLGATDIAGQISILNTYEEYFRLFSEKARLQEAKQANTAVALGALFGFMIFVILI